MKDQILSFVRTLLIAIGTFLVGRTIFGHTIAADNWEVWVGAVMTLVGGYWSWVTKELATDQKISLIRTTLASIGAIIIASGKVDEATWTNITGIVVILMTFFLGNLVKSKNAAK